ncbi:uncharacterized protein AB675_4138 [Cyphellophora attinorum]|uniref:Uncharacterized protein n=1 Tax=Cyphellophora attinorum TaxID=1664694 RepID=A0A0N1P085_9EURO|nr:uncharacterized protein AB675_4138 [Phialophora attinorum]KPI38654.1 hypothetical protein AB675_4138 [Phialophora attinorum]
MHGRWISDDDESYVFDYGNSSPGTPIPDILSSAVSEEAWQQTFWKSSFDLESEGLLDGIIDNTVRTVSESPGYNLWDFLGPARYEATAIQAKAVECEDVAVASVSSHSDRKRKLPLLAPKPIATLRPAPHASSGTLPRGLRPLAPKSTSSVAVNPTTSKQIPETAADTSPTAPVRAKRTRLSQQASASSTAASLYSSEIFNVLGLGTFHPRIIQNRFSKSTTQSGALKRTVSACGVLWAVREAWPAAEGYWNLTSTFRGFLATELYRNFPCERTYRQLPPAYRPTRLQLLIPHARQIDWLPWPDVRDLAIRYQDELDIDAVFRMAILNVVAHRKDITSSRPMQLADETSSGGLQTSSAAQNSISFRVWDLICLEKANGTEPLADSRLERRAVVRSPSVKAVLSAYELECDRFETQKLDDAFFEAFPCLFCESAASMWKIQAPKDLRFEDVGRPAVLTADAVERLSARVGRLLGHGC